MNNSGEFMFESYVPLNILMGAILPVVLLIWGLVKFKSIEKQKGSSG